MRGVQKCICAGAALRGRNSVLLCCIKLDTVTNFACGTGGFPVDTLHHVEDTEIQAEDLSKLQHSFYGVEKKQLSYMICTTNMLLNDITEPDIMHDNSLEQHLRKYTDDDKFDVILMN